MVSHLSGYNAATAPKRALFRRVALVAVVSLWISGATWVRAGGTIDATWDGGTANWSSASNWSTNPQIPNGDFNAFINAGQVTLDANYDVVALTLGGGEITGPGARTLTASGLFSWQGGTLSGGMKLQANGGIISTSAGNTTLDGSTLVNASNQAVNNNFFGFNLTLKNGAVFHNLGALAAQNTFVIADGGGAESSFSNVGTLTLSIAWATSSVGVNFNNTGSVQIGGGNLALLNGSSSSGSYDIEGNGQLELRGGAHVLHPGSSFTGVGVAAITGGTLDFDGDVGPGTGFFSFAGGTVNTSGSLTVGTAGFGFTAPSHAIITAGTITANDGVFFFDHPITLTPGVIVSLGGTTLVRNKGASGKFMTPGPSYVLGSGSATFLNDVGAVFDVSFLSASNPAAFTVESGNPTFENAGTFHLNVFESFGINWTFNNSGIVLVEGGTLTLNGGGTSTGQFDFQGGSVLFAGGTHVFNAGTSFTSASGFGYPVLTGGTLKFGGAIGNGTGDFILSGGTVDTSGSLSVGRVGVWPGYDGGVSYTKIANGRLIGNTGVYFNSAPQAPRIVAWLDGTASLVNNGPNGIFRGGNSYLQGSAKATFLNALGATFTLEEGSPTAFVVESGNPVFENAGTLICGTYNFVTFGIGWAFNNSGTVQITNCQLSLNNGGVSSGTFDVGVGFLIFGGGTHLLNPGINFLGINPVILTGGTLQFGGAVGGDSGHLYLRGGTIDTTGTLTVDSANFQRDVPDNYTTVKNGTIVGQNGVGFSCNPDNPGAIGVISGSGVVVNRGLNGKFDGMGPGYVFGGGGGSFQNAVGAVFTAQNGNPFAFYVMDGAPTINNAGTFICRLISGGPFGIGWTFNNTGVVQVDQGELALNGVVAQYDFATSALTGGTWRVAGGYLDGNGLGPIATNSANVILDGNGFGFPSLNALTNNSGAFTITNGRVFQTSGDLLNPGGITIGSSALLIVTGAFTQPPSGSLTIQPGGTFRGGGSIAGTLSNAGLFMWDGPDALTLTGNVTNNGTIRVRGGGGFNASGATSFINNGVLDLITAGAATLPPNFANGANGIVLTDGSVLVKSTVKTGGTVLVTIDSYTGHTYQLQRSDGLGTETFLNAGGPQQGFTGTTLAFADTSPTASERFYRIVVDP